MRKIVSILVILFLISGITAMSFAQTTNTTSVTKSEVKAEVKPEVKAEVKAEVKTEVIKGKIISINTAKNEIVVKISKTDTEKKIIVEPAVISTLKVKQEVSITLKAGSNVAEKVKVIPSATAATKKSYKK
ncbi:MAG: hypothetical protein NTY14_02735 [Candidatus Omnitrophica bacterium]|nr:hypothetical protein [Candidatus Omnitrophota bacterium]